MDFLLSKCNQQTRNDKRIISKDYIIRKRGGLLHVCLNSPGCRYRNSGSCTMCDYGQGEKLTEKGMESVIQDIKKNAVGMQSILIGTLGSVLDSAELSREYLAIICDALNELPIETVIFETHYTMVDDMICQWLKKRLPQKDIVIEVGLESVDAFVQEKCLNKIIDLMALKSKIELLHDYGMSITVNVFFGAPFLSVKGQIEDAEKTINWAVDNEADSVVIFPANIRKNTILEVLYKNGRYLPVQHWAVFELLCSIPLEYLNRIYLAWYGDWTDMDEMGNQTNYPPYSCEICKGKWMEFYSQFISETDNMKRKHILEIYGNKLSLHCDCRSKFLKALAGCKEGGMEERADKIRKWLMRQYEITLDE